MRISDPLLEDLSVVASGETSEGFPAFTPVLSKCVHFLHKMPPARLLSAGSLLVEQDCASSSVQLIESGLVKLVHLSEMGREITMGLRSEGWYAGYPSALLKERNPYSAIAVTPCKVVRIPVGDFTRYLAKDSEMLEHFLCVLCMEIAAQASLEVELMSSSAESRLDHFLRERSAHHPLRKILDPLPILKQLELAQLLAVTPEHLSRLMKKKKIALRRS